MLENQQFLADNYPQENLFTCNVSDAVLKGVVQEMERPFYSLLKKPVTTFGSTGMAVTGLISRQVYKVSQQSTTRTC